MEDTNHASAVTSRTIYFPGILRTVNFHVTNRCGLSCPCCYQDSRAGPDLPLERIVLAVKMLADAGVRELMISGGDPLLRPDLEEILAVARFLKLKTYLATNGSQWRRNDDRELSRIKPDLLFLGLDPYPGGTDKSEPAGDLDLIPKIQETGQRMVINLIISRSNLLHLDSVMRRFGAAGVRHVNWLRPKADAQKTWINDTRLGPDDLKWLQRARLRLSRKTGIRISLDCAFGPLTHGLMTSKMMLRKQSYACSAGQTYFHIDHQGDVYPCPYLTGPALRCGNVFETPVRTIWLESPVLRKLREHESLKGRCGGCSLKESCRGCRAMAMMESGDWMAEDPDCPFGERQWGGRWREMAPTWLELGRFSLNHVIRRPITRK